MQLRRLEDLLPSERTESVGPRVNWLIKLLEVSFTKQRLEVLELLGHSWVQIAEKRPAGTCGERLQQCIPKRKHMST